MTGYIGESKELQIGPETIINLVAETFELPKELVKLDKKLKEDLDILINGYMNRRINNAKDIEKLEISEILTTIDKMKCLKGKGAKEKRLNLLISLARKCDSELQFIYLLKILKVSSQIFKI